MNKIFDSSHWTEMSKIVSSHVTEFSGIVCYTQIGLEMSFDSDFPVLLVINLILNWRDWNFSIFCSILIFCDIFEINKAWFRRRLDVEIFTLLDLVHVRGYKRTPMCLVFEWNRHSVWTLWCREEESNCTFYFSN